MRVRQVGKNACIIVSLLVTTPSISFAEAESSPIVAGTMCRYYGYVGDDTYFDPADFREYSWVRWLEYLPFYLLLIWAFLPYIRQLLISISERETR